jgi:rapamycin-insensitive companion of mTOR
MPNASTTSPKAYPASARVRGGSGSSAHLVAPRNNGTSNISLATTATGGAAMGSSNTSNGPGGFSSSMRTTSTAAMASSTDLTTATMTQISSEALVEELQDQLNKAQKYQEGAENYLQVFEKDPKRAKEAKKARIEAEKEYNERTREITLLQNQIDALKTQRGTPVKPRSIETFPNRPIPFIANGARAIGGSRTETPGSESPTVSLTDVLRDMEEPSQRNEFYIEKANQLVVLLKKHPNLKYELNWDTFGHRLHSMLLHECKEVVAAGYRVTRSALTDVHSLRMVRKLNVDQVVILSLVSKSIVEREQALKFVRAFLEIPNGVSELSRSVVRSIVSCAEQVDDRLRGIAMETLAEILVLDPALVVSAGGVRVLTQVLGDGPWEIADSISLAFLYLLDMPATRNYVRAGHDLEVGLAFKRICLLSFESSESKSFIVDRVLSLYRCICRSTQKPLG